MCWCWQFLFYFIQVRRLCLFTWVVIRPLPQPLLFWWMGDPLSFSVGLQVHDTPLYLVIITYIPSHRFDLVTSFGLLLRPLRIRLIEIFTILVGSFDSDRWPHNGSIRHLYQYVDSERSAVRDGVFELETIEVPYFRGLTVVFFTKTWSLTSVIT